MSDAASETADQTLVGIAFGDAFRAQEFLTAATRLNAKGQLRLRDAVFVAKDESGKTVVRETIDPQPGRTALSGALWAGLFGLILGGPVGWLVGAGVGAGTGAVTAKVIDHGVPDEWVEWFREAVQPGTTTLALLVEDLDRNALVAELERFAGAKLVYANLDAAWVERIRAALHESSSEAVPAPTPSPPPPPVDAGPRSDLPPPSAPA
jgi:uncharacterized membrane protein